MDCYKGFAMANEIISSRGGAKAAREDRHVDFSSIPGHYFRAVNDIPEREEKTFRDVNRWDSASESVGKKEITYRARRAVAGGTVLLATRLNWLDETLHSVELAAHPEDPDRSPLVFMADEFFTLFVADAEGERKRAEETARVQEKIADLQAKLSAPPPDMLLLPGQPLQTPSTTALVKAVDRKEDLAGRAAMIAAEAEQRLQFIQAGTQEITRQTQLLANYYQEKASAALATVSDQIKFAKDLNEGLKSLSLYMGEDVEVRNICEGEPAASSEPLTLYQDRLYLDEELAVESLSGGFDFKGLSGLGELLSSDRSLLERMIPAKRGAVLVRIRRGGKRYFSEEVDAIANALMNAENFKVFLLVRNGDNAHLVHSEITTDQAERLFPTAKEIEDIFKNFDLEIRPEHLDYSKARTEFEQRTVFYKRMLLMLWGLNDRLGLFGDFYDKTAYPSWYDERFQHDRIVYVHDGEGTLVQKRPTFWEWLKSQNRNLQSGSRIVAVWRKMINASSAPACFSRSYHNGEQSQLYYPVETAGIGLVERKGDRLQTKCTVKGHTSADFRERIFDTRIDIADALRNEPLACLCIDRVTVEDLDYYLNSRSQRVGYLEYFHLFKAARDFLAEEEANQSGERKSLLDDLAHAEIADDIARDASERAIALWRAQQSGRLIGNGWSPSERRTVLDAAYALAGKQADLLDRVRSDIPEVVPIEIRIDGRGNFWLYREPKESEVTDLEKSFDPAFVSRVQLRIGKTKVSETGTVRRVYLANPAFDADALYRRRIVFNPVREETVVADADLVSKWRDRHLPGWISFETLSHLQQSYLTDAEACFEEIRKTLVWVEYELLEIMKEDKTDRVAVGRCVIPLGVVAYSGETYGQCALLCAEGDMLDILASLGAVGRAKAEAIVNRVYARPEGRLERLAGTLSRLEEGELPFRLVTVPADEAKNIRGMTTANSKDLRFTELPSTYWRMSSTTPGTYSFQEATCASLGVTSSESGRVAFHWFRPMNEKIAQGLFHGAEHKER